MPIRKLPTGGGTRPARLPTETSRPAPARASSTAANLSWRPMSPQPISAVTSAVSDPGERGIAHVAPAASTTIASGSTNGRTRRPKNRGSTSRAEPPGGEAERPRALPHRGEPEDHPDPAAHEDHLPAGGQLPRAQRRSTASGAPPAARPGAETRGRTDRAPAGARQRHRTDDSPARTVRSGGRPLRIRTLTTASGAISGVHTDQDAADRAGTGRRAAGILLRVTDRVPAALGSEPFKKLSIFLPMWNEQDYIERAVAAAITEGVRRLVDAGHDRRLRGHRRRRRLDRRDRPDRRRAGRGRPAHRRRPPSEEPQARRGDQDRVRHRHRRPRAVHRRRPAVRHGRGRPGHPPDALLRRRHRLAPTASTAPARARRGRSTRSSTTCSSAACSACACATSTSRSSCANGRSSSTSSCTARARSSTPS